MNSPWQNDPIWQQYCKATQAASGEEKERLAREANQYLIKNYTEQPMLLAVHLMPVQVAEGVSQEALL